MAALSGCARVDVGGAPSEAAELIKLEEVVKLIATRSLASSRCASRF